MTRQGRYKYTHTDLDYYGVYLSEIDTVVYPSVKFGGITIRTDIPTTNCSFWWYEDFLYFTDIVNQRTTSSFGVEILSKPRLSSRKIIRPTKEHLHQLVWEQPVQHVAKNFGVSGTTIAQWCKDYGISKPSRGYWQRKSA